VLSVLRFATPTGANGEVSAMSQQKFDRDGDGVGCEN
jgi:hypothetical protein